MSSVSEPSSPVIVQRVVLTMTADVAKDTGLVGKDKRGLKQQFADFSEYFSNWKHARTLFAVSASWFLLYVQIHHFR